MFTFSFFFFAVIVFKRNKLTSKNDHWTFKTFPIHFQRRHHHSLLIYWQKIMFPEMANEIQTVCWSNRTVPQHHKFFRVRESRPLIVQLALTALITLFMKNFIFAWGHAAYCASSMFMIVEQKKPVMVLLLPKPLQTGRYCELIYYVNLIAYNLEKAYIILCCIRRL